jgi:flagellar motor switch protein FliG
VSDRKQRKLEGAERVAALLLAMGKPIADRVLKYFEDSEIKLVAQSAADLGLVPKATLEDLVDEFAAGVEGSSGLQGTAGEVEELLTGIVSPEQMAEILSTLRGHASHAVWQKLAGIPETAVAQFLVKEHPQVVALVMAKIAPSGAAGLTSRLPADLRNQVMRRMLSMEPVMDRPMRILENLLQAEVLVKVARATGQDIHARIADILNRLERAQMDDIFKDLDETRPKDAKVIKGLLFTFDDIVKLSESARQKLFDAVPPDRVIMALRGADAKMSDLVLSCLGGRARRMIEQELQMQVQVNPKDVVKARRVIADTALNLAEKGVIEINRGEEA